jgi:hypothetical protein
MPDEIYEEPSKVTVEDGDVHVKGPDGVDVLMTPDAAAETSDRLLEGSVQAQGERVERRWDESEQRKRHP